MKLKVILTLFLVVVTLTSAETLGSLPSREELENFRAKQRSEVAENAVIRYEKRVERKKHPSQLRLKDDSVVLSYLGYWTYLPAGSVIAQSSKVAERVGGGTEGRFVKFSEFFERNRSWIQAVPVTLEQAWGKEEISDSNFEVYLVEGKIVVSTYNGNPISFNGVLKEEN